MFGVNDNNDQNTASSPAADVPTAPAHNPISGHSDHSATAQQDQPSPPSPAPADDSSSDDLLELKQKALNSLAPMVSKLEQSPEEKFKTLMMMIQASDNSGLIKDAYSAAQQITDEKERAQALIDIVNEINYFTQNK